MYVVCDGVVWRVAWCGDALCVVLRYDVAWRVALWRDVRCCVVTRRGVAARGAPWRVAARCEA